MKNKLLGIALFCFAYINAQELKKDDFYKAVDYVTCICVTATPSVEAEFDCNVNILNKNQIKDAKTKKLYDELQSLKEEVVNDHELFLTETIFNDPTKYKVVFEFAEKRKGRELDEIKESISKYFIREQNDPDQIIEHNISKEPATQETTTVKTIENQPVKPSLYQFSLWDIILGLFVCGILFLLFRLGNWIDNVERKFSKELKQRTSTSSFESKNNFNMKIDRLENEIMKLRNTIQDPKVKSTHEEKPAIVELRVPPPPPPPADEIFFMATPSAEKLFDESGRSEIFRPTQSLYRFKVDIHNKSMATFEFHSDSTGVSDSVNYPHTYLDPVCEPLNAVNQNAQRIVTIKPGMAEKRNDKWYVTSKAQIRYE